MALYLDPPERRTVGGRLRWTSHLISDTSLAELHNFAQALGLPAKAFHEKPRRSHYDLLDTWVGKAIAAGAVPISAKALVEKLIATYGE